MEASSMLPPRESLGPAINAVAWTGFSVSLLFVIARVFTRSRVTGNFGWDDGFVLFGTVINLVFVSLSSVSVSYGLGQHIAYLNPADISTILYYSAILQPFGIMSYCIPKLAVVILLIKLMGPRPRGVWFLFSIITVLFISSALSAIFIFAQCDPPSHFWNPKAPAQCMSALVLQDITLFAGSWSAFVDLCLAIFPISIFWDLQMRLKRKIYISLLMGLGVFAMVCAIIKTSNLPEEHNPDFTYYFYPLLVWTFVETDVVIVCACIPVLPRLIPFLRGHDSSQKGSTTAFTGSLPVSGRGTAVNNGGYHVFDAQTSTMHSVDVHGSSREAHELYEEPSRITKSVGVEQRWDAV